MAALRLHYHPLSSYCWKVLVALYETGTPFEPLLVDLGDEVSRAAFYKLWPIGKFPVLEDKTRGRTVPESTIVIEYLAQHYPGNTNLIPKDADLAWQTRLQDRFFDCHVHDHVQRIVANKLRPPESKDPYGASQARSKLQTSYGILNETLAGKTWAMGDAFTLADCAAAPALFYAALLEPFGTAHANVASYLERLKQRPSFARVIQEAQPYFHMFPGG